MNSVLSANYCGNAIAIASTVPLLVTLVSNQNCSAIGELLHQSVRLPD